MCLRQQNEEYNSAQQCFKDKRDIVNINLCVSTAYLVLVLDVIHQIPTLCFTVPSFILIALR